MKTKDPLKYVDSIQDHFDQIYLCYFARLHRFAKEYVISPEDAENIVQDVFMLLWEKRAELNIQISLTAYLFSLVKNKCIDFLRRKLSADEYRQDIELHAKLFSLEEMNRAFSSEEDIEECLRVAIDKLPQRCREIFLMSRVEGKKYREIADELKISVNTVENQMSTAFKKLRIELKDYLPLLFFLTGLVK